MKPCIRKEEADGREHVDIMDREGDLLDAVNRDIKNEIFGLLGLGEDCSFDEFSEKFGGLGQAEIFKRIVYS